MTVKGLNTYKKAVDVGDVSLIISTMRVVVENCYKEILKQINLNKYEEIYNNHIIGQGDETQLSKKVRTALEIEIGSRCFTSVFNLLNGPNHEGINEEDGKNLLSLFFNEWNEIIFYAKKILDIDIPNHKIDSINNNSFFLDYYNKIANLIYSDTEGKLVNKKNMYYFVEEVKVKISEDGKIFFENIARAWYQSRGNRSTKITFYSKEKLVSSNCYTMDLLSVEFIDSNEIKFLYAKNINYKIKPSLRTNIERVCQIQNLNVVEFDNLSKYLFDNSLSLFSFLNLSKSDIENKYNQFVLSQSKNSRKILDSLLSMRDYMENNSHGRLLIYSLDDEIHNRLFYDKLNENLKYNEITGRGRKRYSASQLLHTGLTPFDNDPIIFNPPGTELSLETRISMVTMNGYQRNLNVYLSIVYYAIISVMDDVNNELLPINEEILKKINNKICRFINPIESLENLENIFKRINKETKISSDFYQSSRIMINEKYISILEKISDINRMFNNLGKMKLVHSYQIDSELVINEYKEDMLIFEKKLDENKIEALNILKENRILIINGAAGTGKSLLLKYVSKLFDSEIFDVHIIAHTNAAKENLELIVPNFVNIETTTKFLNNYKSIDDKKLVIILDEAGVVPNTEFNDILNKNPEFLIIAGDYYQLPSIDIGNWFETLCEEEFIKKIKLENNYRANDCGGKLNAQWKAFRDRKSDVFLSLLDSDNFLDFNGDQNPFEILTELINQNDASIISLGYSGIFGVNNCNYIIQQLNNPERELFHLNCMEFKIGDRIIFDANSPSNALFYNNLKGKITNIVEEENCMTFYVETYRNSQQIGILMSINWIKVFSCEEINNKYRIVLKIKIDKYNSESEEGVYRPPFHISYSNSIHKSQGLEYDTILVITSPNLEDMTFNILYTAITRAKNNFILLSNPKNFNKNLVRIFEENPKISTLLQKLISSNGRYLAKFAEAK